jgi:hypothetical protein
MNSERRSIPEVQAEVVGDRGHMSSNGGSGSNSRNGRDTGTLVDTLFDLGLAWAEFGVGQGKHALETSAKTLEKVAQTLEDLQRKLRKGARKDAA